MKKIKKILLGLFLGTSLVGSTITLSVIMSSCSQKLPKIAVTDLLDNSPIEDYFQNKYGRSLKTEHNYSTNILTNLETRVYEPYEILDLRLGSKFPGIKNWKKFQQKEEITKEDWESDNDLRKIKYIKSISNWQKIKKLYIPEHIEVIGDDIFNIDDSLLTRRPIIEINKLPDNLLYLGANDFIYKELTLPKTLRYIGENAFARTWMIEDFKDMSSLNKLRYIGQNAFGNLTDKTYIQFDKLIFPDSLEVLNDAYSWSFRKYNIYYLPSMSSKEESEYFYNQNTIYLTAPEIKMPRNLKYFSGSSFNLTKVQSLDFTNVDPKNFETLFPDKPEKVKFSEKIYPGHLFQFYMNLKLNNNNNNNNEFLYSGLRNVIRNPNIILKGHKPIYLDPYSSQIGKEFLNNCQGEITLKLPGFMEPRFTRTYINPEQQIYKTNNVKFKFFY